MSDQSIILRFAPGVSVRPSIAALAVDIAVDFCHAYQERDAGASHAVGYLRAGYSWSVWWTRARAVVVRCQGVANDRN